MIRITVCVVGEAEEEVRSSGDAKPIAAEIAEMLKHLRPRTRVRFVIHPAACEVRQVTTPPLTMSNAARFVATRSAAIFFRVPDGRTSVSQVDARGTRWIACAVPKELADGIRQGAHDAGVRVDWIAPLQEIASHGCKPRRRRDAKQCFQWDGVHYTLLYEKGRLSNAAAIPAATGGCCTELTPERLNELARKCTPKLNISAKAALGLGHFRLTIIAASVALCLSILVLDFVATRRELIQTKEHRLRIREVVATAARTREEMTRIATRINGLESTAGRGKPLSAAMVAFSRQVPADAQLTHLTLRGDTIVIEGVTPSTEELYRRILTSGVFARLGVAKPPQRVAIDSNAVELFTLNGLLAR